MSPLAKLGNVILGSTATMGTIKKLLSLFPTVVPFRDLVFNHYYRGLLITSTNSLDQ